MQYMRHIAKFIDNTSGNVSTLSAIAAIPLIASIGLSIDYSLISTQKAELQQHADAEALERRGGRWLSPTVYQVEKQMTAETYFMGIMGSKYVTISVSAQSELKDPLASVEPGSVIPLKGDASDYNVSGFYCFNPTTNERHTFTNIADNRDGSFVKEVTSCKTGESVEFFLKNYNLTKIETKDTYRDLGNGTYEVITTVGYSREHLQAPCSPQANPNCEFNFFLSDSGNKNNVSLEGVKIKEAATETVVCDTLNQCLRQPCTLSDKSQCINYTDMGGKIPRGTFRKPLDERHLCSPGKHIYFGWEDTPVKTGFMEPDFDYNDFAMLISCPDSGQSNGRFVYLMR